MIPTIEYLWNSTNVSFWAADNIWNLLAGADKERPGCSKTHRPCTRKVSSNRSCSSFRAWTCTASSIISTRNTTYHIWSLPKKISSLWQLLSVILHVLSKDGVFDRSKSAGKWIVRSIQSPILNKQKRDWIILNWMNIDIKLNEYS